MKKFAQSVAEDLASLENNVNRLRDAMPELTNLGMLYDDKKLQRIYHDLSDTINELDEYTFAMLDALETYEKPSMEKEDVFDVIEERY